MYFTTAELTLLLLQRQLEQAKATWMDARRRKWTRIRKAAKKEIDRLHRRVANQELAVLKDNDRRATKKKEWLAKLA